MFVPLERNLHISHSAHWENCLSDSYSNRMAGKNAEGSTKGFFPKRLLMAACNHLKPYTDFKKGSHRYFKTKEKIHCFFFFPVNYAGSPGPVIQDFKPVNFQQTF